MDEDVWKELTRPAFSVCNVCLNFQLFGLWKGKCLVEVMGELIYFLFFWEFGWAGIRSRTAALKKNSFLAIFCKCVCSFLSVKSIPLELFLLLLNC